jgi:hypothetical protein
VAAKVAWHGIGLRQKAACGLPCLSYNTALGLIERKYELARAYLDSPPAQLAVVAAA